ncbi:MAG TPA: substrate-binding domain-containing protein, partial [Anaerolineae bacterium]
YQLTRHLIGLGHKRIAYLGNARAGRTTHDRLRGYQAALNEAGLTVRPEYVTDGPNGLPEGGLRGLQQLLELPTRPTAIVCYNDVMAIGAIQALQQAGLDVPGDCSITGFDDIELAGYVNPPLTTFNQPKYELGCQAAKMMLRLLNREAERKMAAEDHIIRLRGQMRVRASTAPPFNTSGGRKS